MDFLHIVGQLNVLIEHSAGQWWVIPLVSLFCLIDGFFLFLPSETAIVALASIAARSGEPNIWLLILGASIGAIVGDNIAYLMGRKLGTTRFAWMRRPRGAKAFAWAGKELEKRGAMLIFTARYIPVGRIAVNFTAGATYFPWRRFVLLDGIAVVTWAGYSVAVGTFAGRWVHDNPLLGVGIAITFAIVIGFIVDHAMKYLHHFLEKRGRIKPRPAPGAAAAEHAARVQAEAAQAQSAQAQSAQAQEAADGARPAGAHGPATAEQPGAGPAATPQPGAAPVHGAEGRASTHAEGAPVANVGEAPGWVPGVGHPPENPAVLPESEAAEPWPAPLPTAAAVHAPRHQDPLKLAQHDTHP